MKNKLSDLNNHLFAQLERLSDESLSQEALETELQRSSAIVEVSDQIINTAKVALDAAKLVANQGGQDWHKMLPDIGSKKLAPPVPASLPTPDYSDEA